MQEQANAYTYIEFLSILLNFLSASCRNLSRRLKTFTDLNTKIEVLNAIILILLY